MTTGRRACRRGRGRSRPRNLLRGRLAVQLGEELAPDELRDLLDRRLAREPGRLLVPAAAALPRDRRDVEVLRRRPQADATSGTVLGGWLADERGDLRAFDGAEVVDD